MSINLLDVVALTVDLPEYNLSQGQVVTVVEILASSQAFERVIHANILKYYFHNLHS
jgi:Domain of unknown function (DUF4926)